MTKFEEKALVEILNLADDIELGDDTQNEMHLYQNFKVQ